RGETIVLCGHSERLLGGHGCRESSRRLGSLYPSRPQESPMHKDLEAWLDQVWKEKDRLIARSPTRPSGRGVHLGDGNPAIREVYGMYNDAGGATSNDMSAVPPFIDELDNLENAVGVAALLQV